MADELDSGSSVGNYVWVQVPSSAVTRPTNKNVGLVCIIGDLLWQKLKKKLFVP